MVNKEYYVYACMVNDLLVYVGKGKKDRILHCTSGRSSCAELNRDLFKYGKYKFNVFKVVENLTEDQAYAMEKAVLLWDQDSLSSLYNRTYGKNSKQDFDEQLALEFWYMFGSKTEKNFKWNGWSLFDVENKNKFP